MLKKLVYLILGLAVSLSACGSPQVKNEPLTHIRLPVGYVANIQFAPFYAAMEKGFFKDA